MPHVHLHVKKAHIEDGEGHIFNKMDPRIHLSLGDHNWHTSTCENGGKNPEWHGEFANFEVPSVPHKLHIRVMNMHGGHQDVVLGTAEVPFHIFHDEGKKDHEEVDFHHDGHKRGHIHFMAEVKHH